MFNKTCFLLVCLALISTKTLCQNTFIPDDNFEQALINLGLDSGPLDDFILTTNISSLANLDVAGMNITDLTGIEDFKALTNLDCSDNQLTALNISLNTNLIELYCSNNQLIDLDVTNQSNLVRLWCFSNQLTNLNITQNTGLISLRCENNNLVALDISTNQNLTVLICEQNQLTSLNVANNTVLNRFQCGNNLLSNLDVSTNTNLSYLSCEQNQLTSLNLATNNRLDVLICFNNAITELDLSQNSNLTDLNCSNNQLCRLNIRNGNNNNILLMNFNLNPDLDCVVVDDPNGNHLTWQPTSFSNYVNSTDTCANAVPVDSLNDFIGVSYTLPILNNGNYFTQSGGIGPSLNVGDVITTSQTIYIYNEENCYSNESNFNIIISNGNYFIPKYFTPNNDGKHDIWQVLDNSNSINNITIYNRHGKLLKFLPANSQGWDGTFNGAYLSSDSYWYEIVLNTGEVLRGKFALMR
ncbi:hypothetical protein GCM10023311_15380 [Flaviramulus aquimarinus]|uniref:Gliding motility-associated C-terminal domain-containing protein n=1 Tax=Flaviramulus aquimarinus TaxID=1170456 RepID=A0ABP9F183_9FLAO